MKSVLAVSTYVCQIERLLRRDARVPLETRRRIKTCLNAIKRRLVSGDDVDDRCRTRLGRLSFCAEPNNDSDAVVVDDSDAASESASSCSYVPPTPDCGVESCCSRGDIDQCVVNMPIDTDESTSKPIVHEDSLLGADSCVPERADAVSVLMTDKEHSMSSPTVAKDVVVAGIADDDTDTSSASYGYSQPFKRFRGDPAEQKCPPCAKCQPVHGAARRLLRESNAPFSFSFPNGRTMCECGRYVLLADIQAHYKLDAYGPFGSGAYGDQDGCARVHVNRSEVPTASSPIDIPRSSMACGERRRPINRKRNDGRDCITPAVILFDGGDVKRDDDANDRVDHIDVAKSKNCGFANARTTPLNSRSKDNEFATCSTCRTRLREPRVVDGNDSVECADCAAFRFVEAPIKPFNDQTDCNLFAATLNDAFRKANVGSNDATDVCKTELRVDSSSHASPIRSAKKARFDESFVAKFSNADDVESGIAHRGVDDYARKRLYAAAPWSQMVNAELDPRGPFGGVSYNGHKGYVQPFATAAMDELVDCVHRALDSTPAHQLSRRYAAIPKYRDIVRRCKYGKRFTTDSDEAAASNVADVTDKVVKNCAEDSIIPSDNGIPVRDGASDFEILQAKLAAAIMNAELDPCGSFGGVSYNDHNGYAQPFATARPSESDRKKSCELVARPIDSSDRSIPVASVGSLSAPLDSNNPVLDDSRGIELFKTCLAAAMGNDRSKTVPKTCPFRGDPHYNDHNGYKQHFVADVPSASPSLAKPIQPVVRKNFPRACKH